MAAALVDAHCCACHHVVTLPTERVSLITAHGITTYGFECPLCQAHTIRVASAAVLAAFARGGVQPRTVLLTGPQIEGEPPVGPPIDEDDWLRFCCEMYALPDAP